MTEVTFAIPKQSIMIVSLSKVSVTLTSINGWNAKVMPFEASEGPRTYRGGGHLVKKSSLGEPRTIHHEHPSLYLYYAYCLSTPESVAATIRTLVQYIANRLDADMSIMTAIYTHRNSHNIESITTNS